MVRVLAHAIFMDGWPSLILILLVFILLILFHTLISLVILGKGCSLMKQHKECTDVHHNDSSNSKENETGKQEKHKPLGRKLLFEFDTNGMDKVRHSEELLRISDLLIDCKHLNMDNQKCENGNHAKKT
uniref:Putative product n=1 Tax=Xenopsylla cheopis TaxID=163159 RepID=A0A6M2E1Q0_XENCH